MQHRMAMEERATLVITSYSIHYTKLYEVLIGRAFWERALDFDFLRDEGVVDEEDLEIFWFAETAAEAWSGILDWYRKCKEPLFPDQRTSR